MASEANALGLRTISLKKKKELDLLLQKHAGQAKPKNEWGSDYESHLIAIHESLKGAFWPILEILPLSRLSYKDGTSLTSV